MASSEVKLTYFDGRGRAEITRFLFSLAGKKYEDNRVGGESWASFKPTTPKGQLPVLEVNGKTICESMAIARFVARETNLYGANNWEAAVCDMVVDTVGGVIDTAVTLKFTAKTEEEKAAATKTLRESVEKVDKFVAQLKTGDKHILSKASLADAALFTMAEFCRLADPECDHSAYTTIVELNKNFTEIPNIAEWLKKRPANKF